jgi:hypothetical protein
MPNRYADSRSFEYRAERSLYNEDIVYNKIVENKRGSMSFPGIFQGSMIANGYDTRS